MRIKIKSILLENFKGCNKAKYEFGEKTKVIGANASGKTTIFDAFTWLLFNKDSLGNEKFSIRPLDTDGNQIDNVEIKVSAVLDIDGKEVELTKVQKQKWVKPRGASVSEFKGNENLYEVDGYPKTEKDYKEYISSLINEDLFKMLTNPTYFPGLKWKEQRDILMRFVTDATDYELAKDKPEFAEFLDELQKAPSTDAIQDKYSKALKEWKNKLGELPVRIDEAQKQKVDVDVAELEIGKKAIAELLKSNVDKQNDISKQYEDRDRLQREIMELKFDESDLKRKANESLIEQKRNLQKQIDEKTDYLLNINNGIQRNSRDIAGNQATIETVTKNRNDLAERWKKTSNEQFDGNTAFCPTCHRELPQEERERLINEFSNSKAERLAYIQKAGTEAKNQIENAKKIVETLTECNKDMKANKEKLEKELVELEKELRKLPTDIDITDTDEYKQLQLQIVDKENQLVNFDSADDIKKLLRDEEAELRKQLSDIEAQIVKADINVKLDERILELQAEQREVAQKVADQEKMINLLEQFIKYKMTVISATVNSKFDGICFKLFENQINGGLKETCECTVHGVPYGSLNNGHRIIAGLQIIKALQQLYGVSAPIFVDNAESVTEGNLPNMDCQMVYLIVPGLSLMDRLPFDTKEEYESWVEEYSRFRIEVL